MQKYSKKKGILETSMEMNDGLCSFILVILVGFISLITGILVRKIFGFYLFEELYITDDFVFLGDILTGFITLLTICLICGICVCIALPIQKQFAIIRYCRLPLTEDEMRMGIEKGDFDSVESYFEFLDKKMNYGLGGHLRFSKQEIETIVNNCTKVFVIKDDSYFKLPTCIDETLHNVAEEGIGRLCGFNNDMFCLYSKVARAVEIPGTDSTWSLYGKAYKTKADSYFK